MFLFKFHRFSNSRDWLERMNEESIFRGKVKTEFRKMKHDWTDFVIRSVGGRLLKVKHPDPAWKIKIRPNFSISFSGLDLRKFSGRRKKGTRIGYFPHYNIMGGDICLSGKERSIMQNALNEATAVCGKIPRSFRSEASFFRFMRSEKGKKFWTVFQTSCQNQILPMLEHVSYHGYNINSRGLGNMRNLYAMAVEMKSKRTAYWTTKEEKITDEGAPGGGAGGRRRDFRWRL